MNPIRTAIYQRLAADTALTALLSAPDAIHHQVAPQSARFPVVIFHKQAGTPAWQFQGAHVQADVWLVKAVDRASSASRVEDIAARVDELLTDAPLVLTGRTLLAVYRESDVDYSEQDGADTYRHCGALFRLVTEPA